MGMGLGFGDSVVGALWGKLLPSLRGPTWVDAEEELRALLAAPVRETEGCEFAEVDGGEAEREREAMERAGGLARIAGLAGRSATGSAGRQFDSRRARSCLSSIAQSPSSLARRCESPVCPVASHARAHLHRRRTQVARTLEQPIGRRRAVVQRGSSYGEGEQTCSSVGLAHGTNRWKKGEISLLII